MNILMCVCVCEHNFFYLVRSLYVLKTTYKIMRHLTKQREKEREKSDAVIIFVSKSKLRHFILTCRTFFWPCNEGAICSFTILE